MPVCTVFAAAQSFLPKKYIQKVIFLVFKKLRQRGVMSVHVVGPRRIHRLNQQYRGKDRVTDVLSFGVEDKGSGEAHDWGDIFLCGAQIRRQAKQFRVPIKEEGTRMIIHGALHLFGYDHETPSQAKKMFPLQECILGQALLL